MAFLDSLRASTGRPAAHFTQPFSDRLRTTPSPVPETLVPMRVVADWLRSNRERFYVVEADNTPPHRKIEILHRPEGEPVGILLWSPRRPMALSGIPTVFPDVFDRECAPLVGLRPVALKQELKAAGYLRCEKNRFTSSLPESLYHIRGRDKRTQRVMAFDKALLADYLPN